MASEEELTDAIWKACELLSIDEGFVAGEGSPGLQLLGLVEEFVADSGSIIMSLMEHSTALESDFEQLMRLSVDMADALAVEGLGERFDADLLRVWWEEKAEPALEEWKAFRSGK